MEGYEIPTYATAKAFTKRPASAKNPRKRPLQLSSDVEMSDSDADADGIPDVELLDYQTLEGKDREQLKEIEAKVVVKIEPILKVSIMDSV